MPKNFAVIVTHVNPNPAASPAVGHPLAVIGPFADRDAAQAAADQWNEDRYPGGDGRAVVWGMWPPKP